MNTIGFKLVVINVRCNSLVIGRTNNNNNWMTLEIPSKALRYNVLVGVSS